MLSRRMLKSFVQGLGFVTCKSMLVNVSRPYSLPSSCVNCHTASLITTKSLYHTRIDMLYTQNDGIDNIEDVDERRRRRGSIQFRSRSLLPHTLMITLPSHLSHMHARMYMCLFRGSPLHLHICAILSHGYVSSYDSFIDYIQRRIKLSFKPSPMVLAYRIPRYEVISDGKSSAKSELCLLILPP